MRMYTSVCDMYVLLHRACDLCDVAQSAVETSKHLEEELRRLKAAHSILLKEVDHLRGIISQASTVIHSSLEVWMPV